jgi:hypothetical protein
MYFASAYPNSALSAGTLTVMALVMAGTLAIWLGLVFLAGRSTRKEGAQPADSHLAAAARPDEAAEEEQDEAAPAPAGQRREAA